MLPPELKSELEELNRDFTRDCESRFLQTEEHILVLAVILNTIEFGQEAFGANPQNEDDVVTAKKTSHRGLHVWQGDANGFNRARANFTINGWEEFVKHMEGYFDAQGSPTFSSTFVATRAARILDDEDGVIDFRIPGGKTTVQRHPRSVFLDAEQPAFRLQLN